jgi:hypothetical protein
MVFNKTATKNKMKKILISACLGLLLTTVVQAGTTVLVSCSGCTPWQPGYITGQWLLFHRGNSCTLKCSPCSSNFVIRYETEYWMCSGALNAPSITGNVSVQSQSGNSYLGTCTAGNVGGNGFPQERVYKLNSGNVTITDEEKVTGYQCCYNLAMSSGTIHHT